MSEVNFKVSRDFLVKVCQLYKVYYVACTGGPGGIVSTSVYIYVSTHRQGTWLVGTISRDKLKLLQ